MKRTFIAIKTQFSKSALELINDIKFDLKDERIKWVEPSNLHLTLFFIGNTSEEQIVAINQLLLEDIKFVKNFKLNCRGIGVFKNTSNPRAIWFGFDESDELRMLKSLVDKIMSVLGMDVSENEFKPHLTIGRTKLINNKTAFKYVVEKYKEIEVQDFEVKEVIFYESILTAKGSEYKVINKFMLED